MVRTISIKTFSFKGIRDVNEDYIIHDSDDISEARVFVLCDGMGGHGHGEIASKTVAEIVFSRLSNKDDALDFVKEDLQKALDSAINKLSEVDTDERERHMGTTLVVVCLNRHHILIGHVGDSRCYAFDDQFNIKFRTADHSEVAEAVKMGFITEEEAANHPKKNLLTHCVQANRPEEIEVDKIPFFPYVLLCSDGVNDALTDKQIEALLYSAEGNNRLKLIEDECAVKSKDNYSAIFLSLRQDEMEPCSENVESCSSSVAVSIEKRKERCCNNCGHILSEKALFCPRCGVACGGDSKEQLNNSGIYERVIQPKFAFAKVKGSLMKHALLIIGLLIVLNIILFVLLLI